MTNEELRKLALRHPERNAHLLGAAQLSGEDGKQNAAPALEREPSRTKVSRRRLGRRRKPMLRVTIITFHGRRMDGDNYRCGCKFLRDSIARWFGLDDAEGAGIDWRYEQVKTKLAPHTAVRVELLQSGKSASKPGQAT